MSRLASDFGSFRLEYQGGKQAVALGCGSPCLAALQGISAGEPVHLGLVYPSGSGGCLLCHGVREGLGGLIVNDSGCVRGKPQT